jgi:hypothetical protein
MNLIPTRVHGLLDYLVGAFLVASPWVLGFSDVVVAKWVMIILGLGALGYSLVTEYEWGLPRYRALPMTWHLALDAGSGLFLAASPWLLGFSEAVALPHVILGLMEVGVAGLTARRPGVGFVARAPRPGGTMSTTVG